MRSSLCIAAGLLVTNIVLVERAPAPKPAVAPQIVEPVRRVRVTADTLESQRLGWLWHAKHAAFAAPPCAQYDPLAIVDADIDPTPGREHVIGNRRFGVAMYAESGTLIAHMDPVGCVAANDGDQSLSLSFDVYMIVRTRQLEADGEHLDAHIMERRGDELVRVLTLDVGGKRTVGEREREVEGLLYFKGPELEVKYHGRQRTPGHAWTEVDEHCTWQLATRSFSCRTRGAERT